MAATVIILTSLPLWPSLAVGVHWTTYAALILSLLSIAGTFIYVWFTYHIMKWAVNQGKANIELSLLTIEDIRRRQATLGAEADDVLFTSLISFSELWRILSETDSQFLKAELLTIELALGEIEESWEGLLRRQISTTMRKPLTTALRHLAAILNWLRTDPRDHHDAGTLRREIAAHVGPAVEILVALRENEFGDNTRSALFSDLRHLTATKEYSDVTSPA